jgi:hypothetical protein
LTVATKTNWDRLGTWASAICAVHCVLTGFAVGLLSVVGLSFVGSPLAEAIFIFAAVLLGSIAVYHGHRKHHSLLPAVIFVLGLGFIVVAHLAFEHHDPGSTLFSVLGGSSLIAFHYTNMRLQRGCSCDKCSHRE